MKIKNGHREPHEVTGNWLKIPALQFRGGAAAEPDVDALRALDDRNANMESVITGLERFIRPLHTDNNSKDFARDQIAAHKVGTKALLWLLNSEGYHRCDLLLYPKFSKLIVHALMAQQSDQILYDLLLTDEPPALLANTKGRQLQIWRGIMLREAVEATTFWAPDSESINKGYACFLRAHNASHPGRKQVGLGIPLSPAFSHLSSLFMCTSPSYVDIAAFNGLVKFLRTQRRDPFEASFERSRFYLHHPAKANAELALDVLRRVSNATTRTTHMNSVFAALGEKTGAKIFLYFVKTAQVLAEDGRTDDAHWVLDFGRSERPQEFANSVNPYKGETGLGHRRRASPVEVSAGVAVDEDGYVVPDERYRKYSELRKATFHYPHAKSTRPQG